MSLRRESITYNVSKEGMHAYQWLQGRNIYVLWLPHLSCKEGMHEEEKLLQLGTNHLLRDNLLSWQLKRGLNLNFVTPSCHEVALRFFNTQKLILVSHLFIETTLTEKWISYRNHDSSKDLRINNEVCTPVYDNQFMPSTVKCFF